MPSSALLPSVLFSSHPPNLRKGHSAEFSTSVYCPNLQEVGGTVRALPTLQPAVPVLRQLPARRLHPGNYNTPWGSRRHEEVQGTGVGGRLGHRGGSLS